MEPNNILVVGNGFDLAHGLPTGYEDFINFIKKNLAVYEENEPTEEAMKAFLDIAKSNGFIQYFLQYTSVVPGWVDLERLIRDIIEEVECFIKNVASYKVNEYFIKDRFSAKLSQILWDFGIRYEEKKTRLLINKQYITEDIYKIKKKYYNNVYGLNIREIKKVFREHLEGLICALQIYLKVYVPQACSEILPKSQIKAINPVYVISFNYTDTYKLYGIASDDVFHVHGSLEKDNMVLGYDDDCPEELEFIYFKKYFQRIQKLTGYINRERFDKKNEYGLTFSNAVIIHFYGHSMDKTDGDIIRELKRNSRGFVVYTYNQEDYEQKVINLIDVFGKEEASKMIQNGFIKFDACQ